MPARASHQGIRSLQRSHSQRTGFHQRQRLSFEIHRKSRHEINMLFTGDIIDMDFGPNGKYASGGGFHLRQLRMLIEKWQTAMPRFDGWNTLYLDNHDSGRSVSLYGSDDPRYRIYAAKMLATYLTTPTNFFRKARDSLQNERTLFGSSCCVSTFHPSL